MSELLTKAIESGSATAVASAVRSFINAEPPPEREALIYALGLLAGRIMRDEERRRLIFRQLHVLAQGGDVQ